MALTEKQQRFVDEYLVDLNATQAASRAGYSIRTAHSQGQRLLKNVEVQAAITAAQQERSRRTQVTADRVLQELARVAFCDLRRLVSWGPNGVTLIDSDSIPDDAAACVAEVSQTTSETGGTTKIKLHPKLPALKQLGDHLGLWKARTPLEELLAALPAELARELRAALAGELPAS